MSWVLRGQPNSSLTLAEVLAVLQLHPRYFGLSSLSGRHPHGSRLECSSLPSFLFAQVSSAHSAKLECTWDSHLPGKECGNRVEAQGWAPGAEPASSVATGQLGHFSPVALSGCSGRRKESAWFRKEEALRDTPHPLCWGLGAMGGWALAELQAFE